MDGISSNKFNHLLEKTSTCDFQIIAITETWLDPTISSSEFLDSKYIAFRSDRVDSNINASKGGGVLIAVRSDIYCEEYCNDKMKPLESICIRIPLQDKSFIYIYTLYIQPTASFDIYNSHCGAIRELYSDVNSCDTVLILGDFNLGSTTAWTINDDNTDYIPIVGDSESAKSIIARHVTSSMTDLDAHQMSSFENKFSNVLDLVYTNEPDLTIVDKAVFRLLPEEISDEAHVPLICLVECNPSIIPNDNTNTVFCFKKANYDEIKDHLGEINISNIFTDSTLNVNEMVEQLYGVLNEVFHKFVPKATIRSNNKPQWHNKRLSTLKNLRNKAFMNLTLQRTTYPDDDWAPYETKFIAAKVEYENYRSELHNNFIQEKASSLKHNPKSFWQFVNSKRKPNALPPVIEHDNVKATNDIEKANMFAKLLQTVYKKHSVGNGLEDFISRRNENNCCIIQVTEDIVSTVLLGMDINKGSGHDGVASVFLRNCADFMSQPLTEIFSKSLSTCVYPDVFKMGVVTPIFKSGRKSDAKNYRGVNVLPNLAKVFERVMYNQLKLIICPRLKKTQHGFINNRNIETNLFEMICKAFDAFEIHGQLDVFYADIAKAFDSVNTDLLIRKLAKFPISNAILSWFQSYFNNRKQYVRVGSSTSPVFDVTSGVGQGTILGPLLFIAFFDDSDVSIPEVQSSNFADDKKLFTIVKSYEDTNKLQAAIDEFLQWCKENGLDINEVKCNIISYTHKNKPIIREYKLGGSDITRVTKIRDLGVMMDQKLNFSNHIEYAVNKSKAALNFIKRQSSNFSNDTIKVLYTSLVRSIVEFACPIWSPHGVTNKKMIESVQKQLVMLIDGEDVDRENQNYARRPYLDRRLEAGLESLVRRRCNATASFLHKIIVGKFDVPNVRQRLSLNTGIRTLREPEFIRPKFYYKEYLKCCPLNNASHIFNHSALFIDPTTTHLDFKSRVARLTDDQFGPWAKI